MVAKPSSCWLIVKVLCLTFAIAFFALSLYGWADATFYGRGVEVVYPGYVTIQGQSFTELELESALGSVLTVVVLFIDVFQAKTLEDLERANS